MRSTGLPPPLRRSMKAYLWLQHVSGTVDASAFERKLPSFLTKKARNTRHLPLLSRVPLLAAAGEGDARFVAALAARAEELMLMSGLRVFEAGDLAQDLWVVVDTAERRWWWRAWLCTSAAPDPCSEQSLARVRNRGDAERPSSCTSPAATP